MTDTERAAIIAAAEHAANEDCRRGLRDLEAKIEDAPVSKIDRSEAGAKWRHPERAMLQGMCEHLRRSMAARGVV